MLTKNHIFFWDKNTRDKDSPTGYWKYCCYMFNLNWKIF